MGSIALTQVLRSIVLAAGGSVPFSSMAQLLEWVFMITAAVLFSRWLYNAYRDATLLGSPVLQFRASTVIWSFFLPILNLFRPYQGLRALYAASDPATLIDPPRYRLREEPGHYRASAQEMIPPPRWQHVFPLPAWWVTFCGLPTLLMLLAIPTLMSHATLLASRIQMAQSASGLGAAVCAILVVRAIAGRQRERLRRLEAARAPQDPA